MLQVDGTGDSYVAGNLTVGGTGTPSRKLDVLGNGEFESTAPTI